MKIYLAPMEGITGEVYRRAYHTFFEPMDKYFTPFLNPNPKGKFSRQEWNEILPENNEGMYTVPQILTNRAEDFIRLARQLKEFGYEEVNLNLGCPSKTVVNRKRGSGFLFYPDELNHFLAEVFDQLDMKISIKTCPISVKRTATPSPTAVSLLYGHGRKRDKTPSASAIVYSASASGRPALRAFRFFHSASLS